jgi:hypothetical protein
VSVLAEIGATTATSHDEEPARFFSTLLDARRGAEDVDGTSGMGFLIDVRADALEARRAHGEPIERVDAALRSLLSAWLHPGHLQIQRVTFRSSAALCERIVKYERVHPSRNMSDLRARLGSGRRCYALLHPSLPDVPLSMVHCALLDAIPSSLRDVHTRSSEDAPTNAAFWSISSTQDGLRGIDLGHALLKRAVGELRAEFSTLAAFHTLSPIPGFRAWLTRQRESAQSAGSVASAAAAASSDVNARVSGDADLSVLGMTGIVKEKCMVCRTPHSCRTHPAPASLALTASARPAGHLRRVPRCRDRRRARAAHHPPAQCRWCSGRLGHLPAGDRARRRRRQPLRHFWLRCQ